MGFTRLHSIIFSYCSSFNLECIKWNPTSKIVSYQMTHIYIILLFILMSLASSDETPMRDQKFRMMFFVEQRPTICELGYCKHYDAQVSMRYKQIRQIVSTFNCGPETFLCNQWCSCKDSLGELGRSDADKAQQILCLDPLVIGSFSVWGVCAKDIFGSRMCQAWTLGRSRTHK